MTQIRLASLINAVEIEEAISALDGQSFDAHEFPFGFLEAFGNKPTTIKRSRKHTSNKSDIRGVLQNKFNIVNHLDSAKLSVLPELNIAGNHENAYGEGFGRVQTRMHSIGEHFIVLSTSDTFYFREFSGQSYQFIRSKVCQKP